MSTLSTNIAGTERPFMAMLRRAWPYGMVPISELKRKKKKTSKSVVSLESLHEWSNKSQGEGKWRVDPPGKVGHWRRVQRQNVFFPDDGSEPIGMPKANRGKGLKEKDRKRMEKDAAKSAADQEKSSASKAKEISGRMKMMAASIRKTLAKIKELKKKDKKELSGVQRKAIGQEGTVKGMLKALESGDSKKFKKLQGKMGRKVS